MELNTRLDRDRFTWMSHELTSADNASMLVEVTAPPLSRTLSCRLTVRVGTGIQSVCVLNEATVRPYGHGVFVELGDLAPTQTRSLVFQFVPKRAPKPGRRKLATLTLDYVLADDLTERSLSRAVWAHVAGPHDRPGKVDREVVAEVVLQGIQRHQRHATDALIVGDIDAACRTYERALRGIRRLWSEIPLDRRPAIEAHTEQIEDALNQLSCGALRAVGG